MARTSGFEVTDCSFKRGSIFKNAELCSPFDDGVVWPHAGGQQVVPVVQQLVVFAAVSHPEV